MGALVVVEPVERFSRIPQNGKFATTLLTSGGALREQGSSAVFGLWMCWPDHATFGKGEANRKGCKWMACNRRHRLAKHEPEHIN